MREFQETSAANPGRSGHRMSIQAARVVYETRQAVADLLGAKDPLRVIFGLNITDGLNLALHGLLKSGDHVITSSMEHNSVMRPLRELVRKGVEMTQVTCAPDGTLEPKMVEREVKPNTRMIVLNHASNVCGTLLPIQEVARIARNNGLLFLVDAAQTAGVLPVDMLDDHIDLLGFTGHKSLYGPMGNGGLLVGERVDPGELHPMRQGGTGSRSEHEEQPDFFPDCYESGTPNAIGLSGLLAALSWLGERGVTNIRAHEEALCAELLDGLAHIRGVEVYGTRDAKKQTATVAFNIRGMEPSTVGLRLDEQHGVLCRVGLHCAPSAHRTLGTFPYGCVRFGLGVFNTFDDVQDALKAVHQLAREER